MTPGEVFFFKDFKFKDGKTKDKLIIILNYPQDNEPYLVCCTTHVQHFRLKELGCHSEDNYYFVDNQQDNFDIDTWIVFGTIYELSVDKILNACINQGTHSLFTLEKTLWNSMKACILKSKDIAGVHLEMIGRA